MSTEEKGPESILDQAINEIREEPVDGAIVREAAERAWSRITASEAASEADTLRGCADFQALFPAWREGRLAPGRAMLLEDHIHECPACRKARRQGPAPKVVSIEPAQRRFWQARGWAVAAALLVTVGLTAFVSRNYFSFRPAASRAVIQSIDGTLYKVSGAANATAAVGVPVGENETVRTAKASGAFLRLTDGSLVEMAERTDLSISERKEGVTLRLNGGRIIVQAAKQRSRHLYVATEDCTVSVVGTVFAVNHGVKGSRVSVLEGEVKVEHGKDTSVLRPGDQIATSEALAPVPVKDEVAWSRNVDSYLGVVSGLAEVRKQIEALPGPALRYSSRLLDLTPAGTVLYVAVPNIGPTLSEAQRLLSQQAGQNEALAQWLAQKGPQLDGLLGRIRSFSDYLGTEIVLTMAPGPDGKLGAPVLLAELTNGAGLRTALAPFEPQVRIVADPVAFAAPPARDPLYVYLTGDIVAVSPELAQLQKTEILLKNPGARQFPKSAFGTRITDTYRQGVSWLLCADLQQGLAKPSTEGKADTLNRTGLGDLRYLVVQHRDVAGKTENRATLSFADVRRGVASWLAAPAPMRALDFVSPDASFAAAAVVKSPSVLVEELFSLGASGNPNFWTEMADFESKTGLSVRNDLARPLGGEFAFALDGPVLPMPSWKVAIEVYDPVRFEQAVEKVVAAVNSKGDKLRLDTVIAGGQTFYTLRGLRPGLEAHYTFVDGYLIAGPSRELVVRAIQARQSGYTLARSQKFTALVPRDGHSSFSGLVYHSLGTLMEPLSAGLKAGTVLTPEQKQKLEALAAAATPSLVLLYGEQDRIEIASAGSFFGLNAEDMLLGLHRSAGSRPSGSETR